MLCAQWHLRDFGLRFVPLGVCCGLRVECRLDKIDWFVLGRHLKENVQRKYNRDLFTCSLLSKEILLDSRFLRGLRSEFGS